MDTSEYAHWLLHNFQPPPPSEVLNAAQVLATEYLKHLVVMHKYLQEYGEEGPFKRVQLLNMTRVIDGFVTGSHLLHARFYNASLTEMRTIYDSLNLMQWLALAPPALKLYLSNETERILKEFNPLRVRQYLRRTPHDAIYDFLISYATHPFYTGKEYLLSVDLSQPGNLENPEHRHYPALDAVAASIVLLTYAHATYEMGTSFGLSPIVDQDRERLARMFRETEGFLVACEKVMGQHRTIRFVLADFRQNFPLLYDKRYNAQQLEMYKQFQRVRTMYGEGRLPFPPRVVDDSAAASASAPPTTATAAPGATATPTSVPSRPNIPIPRATGSNPNVPIPSPVPGQMKTPLPGSLAARSPSSAGIPVPPATTLPTGFPSELPNDMPTGFPSELPSGFPGQTPTQSAPKTPSGTGRHPSAP